MDFDISYNFLPISRDYFKHMAEFLSKFPEITDLSLNLGNTLLDFSYENVLSLAKVI